MEMRLILLGGHILYEENHREINGYLEKKCNQHHTYFPEEDPWLPCTLDYYYYNKSSKRDGLNTWCKKCAVKKARETTFIKRSRKYYQDNKEIIKRDNLNYKKENREYYIELSRKFRQSEHGKAKAKEYGNNRKPKTHRITEKEWIACKEYFKNEKGGYCCAYCGMTEDEHRNIFKKGLHREHVIFEGRNDIKNCVPACHNCNRSKDNKSLNNWYNSSNTNFTYERYHKIYQWLRYDYKKYIMPKNKRKLTKYNN